jgi:phospho-N-acetylmuramoyl-pentapeptide-transferase
MHYVPQLAWILWLTFLSFSVSILLTPVMTWILYRYEVWKKVKDTAVTGEKAPVFYKLHAAKHRRNIPTMAGVLIWGVVALITLLFNLSRSETWLLVFLIVTVGLLGLVDDFINIRSIGSGIAGIRSKVKMFWLLILSTIGAWWFYYKLGFDSIHVPGVGDFHIGILYIPLFILVVVASANAVNITDGLDGLSGGLLSIAFSCFAVLAYFHNLYGIAGFCATVVGAVLSYTWFNIYPARFFMGDTGAVALGATLGVVALLTNTVLVLPIIGFVFVGETLSVIIQIGSKKLRHKKVFLSAPIHHHFEAIGWPETKVTMRFWIIGAIMGMLGVIIGLIGRGHV